jgi:uncharacterized protein (DUF58 family)
MFKKKEQIYILPTGHGYAFLASVIVMIFTGATYNNNLVYILAFSLFGVVLVAMVHTHVNLKRLTIQSVFVDDTMAGHDVAVLVTLENAAKVSREWITVDQRRSKSSGFIDKVPANDTRKAVVTLPAKSRGRYTIDFLNVSTNYPLGLFRSWKKLPVGREYYVFPRPEGYEDINKNAMPVQGSVSQQVTVGSQHGTDFREHRSFQSGDNYRHVDWKAYARNRPLLVKHFEGEALPMYLFRVRNSSGPALERELSQMSKWIMAANLDSAMFALDVGHGLEFGSGPEHCRTCLRALAMYGVQDAEQTK